MAKLVSTKIELAALRGLCSPNKKISGKLLAGLDETYFYNDEAVDAYKKIRNIITNAGEPPRWHHLLEDPSVSEDTRAFLGHNKIKIKKIGQAETAVKILNKYRQLRGLYFLGEDLIDKLQKKKVDESDLIDAVSDSVAKIRANKSLKDLALHFGKNNNSYELVKKIIFEEDKKNYIPTGFRDYDSKNGGIFYGTLFTIGGSTGGGKSALAAQLALFWSRIGERVVLVPLEMSKEEQTSRLLANVSEIDVRKIILKRLSEDEKKKVIKRYKKYVRRAAEKGGRYTVFKPEQDMTIEEILSITSVYGPKVVIVDYISLLKGVGGQDQWQKLSDVARYCKIFAANNNCIVVLLAQVSEEGKIRYSQGVKEHSDYAWVFVSTKESRENEIINIEQVKGRNAELFPFSLRAQLNFMRIGDLSHEEAEAAKNKAKSGKKDKEGSKPKDDYIDDIADAE